MEVKGIIDEDFVNYKKPSMFIAFPICTFKCEKECGVNCCQNNSLATSPNISILPEHIVSRYINNPITRAIVCGGLEPFDSYYDLFTLVRLLREKIEDDIVIYTGYYKSEIEEKIMLLATYKNIIVKFGRFIPDSKPKYDNILGVTLQSDNQYAEVISGWQYENHS